MAITPGDSIQTELWRVTQCECGHLTLALGSTCTIVLTREEFVRLRALVCEAAERLGDRAPNLVWDRRRDVKTH